MNKCIFRTVMCLEFCKIALRAITYTWLFRLVKIGQNTDILRYLLALNSFFYYSDRISWIIINSTIIREKGSSFGLAMELLVNKVKRDIGFYIYCYTKFSEVIDCSVYTE